MSNGNKALDPSIINAVCQHCLHGRSMSSALEKLWLAKSCGDNFLAERLGIELLTSLDILDAGYGEQIAAGDSSVLANVRAHRRIFERLGFFAGGDEGELALDFISDPVDPPVVQLDSEGQYCWLGANVAEAILRVGEDLSVEETREWLTSIGLPLGAIGDIGVSTQFLPSISDLHDRFYHEEIGAPKSLLPSGSIRAASNDPMTWILRPANEVRSALAQLLRLPANVSPSPQWVDCDSQGRVRTVWFRPVPESMDVAVNGVVFGMTAAETISVLGQPTRTGDGWLSFKLAVGRLRVGFTNDRMDEICLMAG